MQSPESDESFVEKQEANSRMRDFHIDDDYDNDDDHHNEELEALELTAVATGRQLPDSLKRQYVDGKSAGRNAKKQALDGGDRLQPASFQQLQQIANQRTALAPNTTTGSRNPSNASAASQNQDVGALLALALQQGASPGAATSNFMQTTSGFSEGTLSVAQQPVNTIDLPLDQSLRNQQQIVLLLSQLVGGAHQLGGDSGLAGPAGSGSSHQQVQLLLLQHQQEQQRQQQASLLWSSLTPQQQLEFLLANGSSNGMVSQLPTSNSLQNPGTSDLVASLLQKANNCSQVQQQASQAVLPDTSSIEALLGGGNHVPLQNMMPSEHLRDQLQQQQTIGGHVSKEPSAPNTAEILELPPCYDGSLDHWSTRAFFPLGIDEDTNWLSEFHCFVRSELVELFQAGQEDVRLRNSAIVRHQVGMRCRYCAHCMASGRVGRAAAFPSSLRQIYQSFTMMLRDHFPGCKAIPAAIQKQFMELKDRPAQGATDSKRYWIYSGMKLGMLDTKKGIVINATSRANGTAAAPFGTNPSKPWNDENYASIPLVLPTDRSLITEFLYLVMTQVQPIRLLESECIGNRRSLRVGLPGFGCRYCCEHRRLGLCRMFPARRRTLPTKIADMHDHLRRCNLCPTNVKEQIDRLHHQLDQGFQTDRGTDRDFFDRVWSRLGHDSQSA